MPPVKAWTNNFPMEWRYEFDATVEGFVFHHKGHWEVTLTDFMPTYSRTDGPDVIESILWEGQAPNLAAAVFACERAYERHMIKVAVDLEEQEALFDAVEKERQEFVSKTRRLSDG